MRSYQNPILGGSHPDPSICRVGASFYLVNATYELFPGIPVYRSKNLTDWHCVGHVVTRPSQVDLSGAPHGGGLHAATIRHSAGVFYVTCADVTGSGCFLVCARDPAGPWSDPVYLKRGGADPSLLFADGTCYLLSAGSERGERGIYLCEIEPTTGEWVSRERLIARAGGGAAVFAPRLYKISGKYYLMASEGSARFGHLVSIFRSDSPFGPYEPCPHNPIVSPAGPEGAQVSRISHADLVDDLNGRLWLVCAGTREIEAQRQGGGDGTPAGVAPWLDRPGLCPLGLETYLSPVRWEDGWPIVGRGGRIDLRMEASLPGLQEPDESIRDVLWSAALERETGGFFDDPVLAQEERALRSLTLGDLFGARALCFLRMPDMPRYEFDTEDGILRLSGSEATLDDDVPEAGSPTFVGARQEEFFVSLETGVELVAAGEDGSARVGITAYHGGSHHMDIFITREDGDCYVQSRLVCFNLRQERRERIPGTSAYLRITADTVNYHLYFSLDGDRYFLLDEGAVAALCAADGGLSGAAGTLLGFFAERGEAVFARPCLDFLRD